MQTPMLSIGIIFKNEIRSLERCLKALQPLRDAIPCELVMADTGSDDGSREIAQQYADVLFDFPWIDDFAAARNAVIERSSGPWHLVVDSDEYLDENVTDLVNFLRLGAKKPNSKVVPDFGCITIRNYTTYEMDGHYSDFYALRLLRVASGIRYTGVIHEHWNLQDRAIQAESLVKIILHHDGYVGRGGEAGREKRERNIRLLRVQLEKDPDDLLALMQFVESGMTEPDFEEKVRHCAQLILDRPSVRRPIAPAAFSDVIQAASKLDLPEADEWIQKAFEIFPNSTFSQIDVNYIAAMRCIDKVDHDGTIFWGERYLKAMENDRNGKLDPTARLFGTLYFDSKQSEQEIHYAMSNTYVLAQKDTSRALELMETMDYTCLEPKHMKLAVQALRNLHFSTTLDTTKAVLVMWNGISEPVPSAKNAEARIKVAMDACASAFSEHFRAVEQEDGGYCRPSYTLLLPLKDLCDLGKAAAMMETNDPAELEQLLCDTEDLMRIPSEALQHALEHGMPFPPSARPLNVEEMDNLAAGLVKKDNNYIPLVLRTAEQASINDWPRFIWAHELTLAAIRTWPWEDPKEEDQDQSLPLARAFAGLEKEFLPRCYAPEALQEDRLFALSPMHRFGCYCVQAFAALDAGDLLSCVRQLRAALVACDGMTKMVEFLLICVEEMDRASRIASAPPELIELAKRVQATMARFTPDDPAIAELKKSPAYQQVAWIIEKPSGSVFEPMPQ